ncbi:MAG: hypothetical protein ACREKB_09340, partial [Candidatus Rokuibacteriota bacterium]
DRLRGLHRPVPQGQHLLMRLALALAILASAQEAPPITVETADGSRFPLSEWSLSYEYLTWPEGKEQSYGTIARREASELLLGRKPRPLAGVALEVGYAPGRGGMVATSLALVTADGKRTPLKLEPPHKDVLAPGLARKTLFQARGLDLRGRTLTGTARDLCLLSFSPLLECAPHESARVIKLEFP